MKRIPEVLLVFLTMCLCVSSYAEDLKSNEEYRFHIPINSPFAEIGDDTALNPTGRRYKGMLQVEGAFRASWAMYGKQPDHIRLYFFPNDASMQLLPYEEDRFGDESRVHPAKEFWFLNEDDSLAMLLEPSTLLKLKAKKVLSVSGHATVLVSDYETNVDCDKRWYATNLVSVVKGKVLRLQRKSSLDAACN